MHLETRVLVTGGAGFLGSQVIEFTGSRSRIVHRALPQVDPRQRCPDITQAQQVLGWKPKTDLTEGIQRTIFYFDALLGNEELGPLIKQQFDA
jgi:UDP-glucuronate decarboxylase